MATDVRLQDIRDDPSGSQVMLCSYHGSLDGGAAVGKKIDIATLLLHDPARRHGAHFQDRRVLGALLTS